MFSNGRKTIGLFIFNTHWEFQHDICRGMEQRAEELGYNLAIFSSYGNYGTNNVYYIGEMEIFNLPAYDKLAGIVVAFDTFNIPEAKDLILENIRRYAKCPVVSLREPLAGANNVLIDEKHSMEEIISHIIEDHGKKDIAFMTGEKDRSDAMARLECFRRIMKGHELPVGEHREFHGNFWKTMGKEACDWFCQDGKYPEAIICANDYMAMSVIDELHERDLRIPEDVLVTGYDGTEEGMVFSPSLSTIQVDFLDMAYKAVDLIDRHQNDDEVETLYAITEIHTRESCGCLERDHCSTLTMRSANHRKMIFRDNLEMQFSFMSIDFNEVNEIEKMHEVISRYIYNIEDFENYFICLKDDIEDVHGNFSAYTDEMHVRVAIQKRQDKGGIDIPFDRRELIPKEFVSEAPQCYYFFPVHFQDRTYGYEAYSYLDKGNNGEAYVRWNIAVSNAIQNILSQKKMNDLIEELQNMYIQDVLTGLYNRRGFEKYARMQFSQARAKDSMICVIGIDMDGLKPINDIYGHHEGDSALRVVSYAIQEAVVHGQIGARIGGDEFEVIFPCQSEDDAKHWVQVFEQSLDNYNKKSQKPYEVHASFGYKVGIPTADDTIASYMNESDDIMYRNKLLNKRKRNEALR